MSEDIFKRIAEEREAGVKRRRVIAEIIGRLQAEDGALQKRDAELEQTERVLQSVLLPLRNPPPPPSETAAGVLSALDSEQPEPQKWHRRKPKDLPSILEMAEDAFEHYEAAGQVWVSARDVATFVRQKFWPDAKAEYFNGQLWRAAERGDLVKKGSCYARKGAKTEYEEGPDTEVTRPLHSNGVGIINA